jgi:outer membrane protein OmpA-like peptidoglycan-associated protein
LRSEEADGHKEELPMKSFNGNLIRIRAQRVCAVLLAGTTLASIANAQQFTAGDKGKVKGQIMSRNGDLVTVQDDKAGSTEIVKITDDTKIERKKGEAKVLAATGGAPGLLGMIFRGHENMDVTALVPGLTISAEGVGNASGQLEASKITFSPDDFAVAVAEEQQVIANKAAAGTAQSTADQGVTAAGAAQSSADQAQASANQAGATAVAAGAVGAMNTAAVQMLNQRVSDLDDYKTVAEAEIYYPNDKYALDAAAKADLDRLADVALATDGYMIEIAGYASKPGTETFNEQLSEDRAAAVAQYLREQKNIPLRRMLAPAGYGATHPEASNTDPQGRALDRRVVVKVLVNKGVTAASR